MSPSLDCYPALQHIARRVDRLARTTDPVVITGEPGVGKTLIARQIHSRSAYRERPLVIVNLGVLSDRDQRIELLGANPPEVTTSRRGVLERPTTVVVKYPEAVAAFVQDAFARALSVGRITRLGGGRARLVVARLILTLAGRPERLLAAGRITGELYQVLRRCPTLHVPPLRRRGRDMPLLLRDLASELGRVPARHADMRLLAEVLKAEEWHENVMGLKAFLRSLLLVSPDDIARGKERREIERIVMMVEEGKEFSLKRVLDQIEVGLVQRALHKCGGSRTRAARLLGLSDRSIRRRLAKLL